MRFNASRFVILCHFCIVRKWIGVATEKAPEHHASLDSDSLACTQQEIDVGERIQIARKEEHLSVVAKNDGGARMESEQKERDGKDSQTDGDVKSAHGKLHLRFQSFALVETHTFDLIEHIDVEANCC